MEKIKTALSGAYIIVPEVFGDRRGWFMESYNEGKFRRLGITTVFRQDNHSYTERKGTLRGLHFQTSPMAQTKLLRCIRGEIMDVAVDLRAGSPTYLKWTSAVLSEENKRFIYLPAGLAHGFLTLTDNVEVQYKVDNLYSREHDMSIAWNDSAIGVEWGISAPILSEKDKSAMPLGSRVFFNYEER